DSFEVVERGRLLDLGDELHRRRHQTAQLFDVLRTTHERERQIVHTDLHRVADVLLVLVGERRRGDLNAGQIHALVRGQDPAVDHSATHPRRVHPGYLD